jgi:alpha-galactosidase
MQAYRILTILLFSASLTLSAQVRVEHIRDTLIVTTPYLQRGFVTEGNQFYTYRFADQGGYDYSRTGSKEFQLSINGNLTTGTSGDFRFRNFELVGTEDAKILVCNFDDLKEHGIELQLHFEFHENNPTIRKWMTLSNRGTTPVTVTDVEIEKIMLDPWSSTLADVYGQYAAYKYNPPYTGWAHDPFIWIRGTRGTFGIGNEAPGIMKETGIYDLEVNEIRAGLTPSNHPYPFAISINPGDQWTSPATFIILAKWEKKEQTLKQYINSRKDLLPVGLPHNALFYNTWNPFRTHINDTLITELSKKIMDTGFDYLIIDDGWQNHFGDWEPHPEKFPNGLKPVCDIIRQNGLTPGLWLTPFTAEINSDAYKRFADYAVKDINGNPANLHGWAWDGTLRFYTMDPASPWFDHILGKTTKVIEENGIGYVKLDFAVIKSAYVMNPARSGNYDTTSVFSGRVESLYRGYEAMFRYCDSLRARFPELLIDITFELYGHNHIIDYALVQHAHLDWISNFEEAPPYGPAKIREMAYKLSNALPVPAALIGNQIIESPDAPLAFVSNMASIPVILGNPLEMNAEQISSIASISQIYKKYCNSSDHIIPLVKGFRADELHQWDGFLRLGKDSSQGLIVIFRNQSPDSLKSFDLSKYGIDSVQTLLVSGDGIIEQDGQVLRIEIEKESGFVIGLIKHIYYD